jgi:cytosine/adenosine deaminase-related metal-dependent hydrolase
MDLERREIPDGGLFARDGLITQVGPTAELPQTADEVLDLSGHVVLPGLINTHHHLYQTLTRAVPAAQNANLFDWLRVLYPIWARLTPRAVRVSTQVGLAELALSGCTTAADHLYVYPNGCRLDDQIEAAKEVGLRFHASRGSVSLGESDGGLPPDALVEAEDEIVKDSRRLIEQYHDARPGALLRIVVAPCSPFSVSPRLMRDSAKLARAYGVSLHTHLAETRDEEQFCLETFGLRPVAHVAALGWLGPDVWFAHGVHVADSEVQLLTTHGTGVAHCPTSNMRLASGIAPVQAYRRAGTNVGIGVDGSASNDGSHLLAEVRQAMLVARLRSAPGVSDEAEAEWMTAREALEMATRGGAAVLGRDDVGALMPGKCADFFSVDVQTPAFAGALHDPVAAVVFCAPQNASYTVVHGRTIVRDGQLETMDVQRCSDEHNQLARQLVGGW